MKMTSKTIYNLALGGVIATALVVGTLDVRVAVAQDGPPMMDNSMDQDGRVQRRTERRRRADRERRGGRDGQRGDKMGRLGKFLKVVNNLSDNLKEPHNAIGLAVLTIKDHYRKSGKPADAIPELESFLSTTSNQSARNVILFNIRQIYEETRQQEQALKISRQIITENLKMMK